MSRPVILHVEDDSNDVFLLAHAFRKARVLAQVQQVSDGQQAVNYLSGLAPFSDRERFPVPDLVLLDLKLPLMDGFEVLSWTHSHAPSKQVPIIVLSSSNLPADIARAKELGAQDYFVKTPGFEDVVGCVRTLLEPKAEATRA